MTNVVVMLDNQVKIESGWGSGTIQVFRNPDLPFMDGHFGTDPIFHAQPEYENLEVHTIKLSKLLTAEPLNGYAKNTPDWIGLASKTITDLGWDKDYIETQAKYEQKLRGVMITANINYAVSKESPTYEIIMGLRSQIANNRKQDEQLEKARKEVTDLINKNADNERINRDLKHRCSQLAEQLQHKEVIEHIFMKEPGLREVWYVFKTWCRNLFK